MFICPPCLEKKYNNQLGMPCQQGECEVCERTTGVYQVELKMLFPKEKKTAPAKPAIPIRYPSPELEKLNAAVEEYMNYLAGDNYHEDGTKDYEHAIFEKALEAYYGAGVWDNFVNKICI